MDVIRKDAGRRKWIRRIIVLTILVITLPTAYIGFGRLKPAAPVVEGGAVWPDTVKRGPMVRQVRGLGTLVAEDVLWIPATTSGRVQRIFIRPGAAVTPDTVIMTLKNPDVELAAVDTEYQIKAAEARLTDLRVRLESDLLSDQAATASMEAQYASAQLRADRDAALFKSGLLIELTHKISKNDADQLAKRVGIEKERTSIKRESVDAQLAVQRADIDKLKAQYRLKLNQVDELNVRAGTHGVLQEMTLVEGQQVGAGTILAKVAQPTRLKAELKVAETQAKDVIIGQLAQIDTRNGVIPGRVFRIDPAAREGTVVVDVKLEGQLPMGARPDLSVDGTIEVEKLADVVYVGRPAFGQPNTTVTMFKIDADGKGASRVQVKFGRTSVNFIEILEGLAVGDKVILSDMANYDSQDRVRIN